MLEILSIKRKQVRLEEMGRSEKTTIEAFLCIQRECIVYLSAVNFELKEPVYIGLTSWDGVLNEHGTRHKRSEKHLL